VRDQSQQETWHSSPAYFIWSNQLQFRGHKDVSITQRYAHHSPESLRSSVVPLNIDTNLVQSEKSLKVKKSRFAFTRLVNTFLDYCI